MNTDRVKYYTLEYKAKIILYLESLKANPDLPVSLKSINHMSRLTGIDRRITTQWLETKNTILNTPLKRTVYKVPTS